MFKFFLFPFYVVNFVFNGFTWPRPKRRTKESHRESLHKQKIAAAQRRLDKLQDMGARNGLPSQLNYLRKVDALVFEEMILTAIEAKSNTVIRNTHYTGDGGVDGTFMIKGKRYLVQAKRYSGYVRPSDVYTFANLCKLQNLRGIFVHTGKTGPDSYSAAGKQVEIISGKKLISLLLRKDQQARSK